MSFVVEKMRRLAIGTLQHEAGDTAFGRTQGMLSSGGQIESLVGVEIGHERCVNTKRRSSHLLWVRDR